MSGIPAGSFGLILLLTAVALLGMQAVTFAVALKTGRHSVADVAWGFGIALAALVSLLVSAGHGQPARRYLLLAVSVTWGLRHAGAAGRWWPAVIPTATYRGRPGPGQNPWLDDR
jgi:steroid 5-alpha reductase family enzyme